jgi:hypothetical protein
MAAILDLINGHMTYARMKGNGDCAITLQCYPTDRDVTYCTCKCCDRTYEQLWQDGNHG